MAKQQANLRDIHASSSEQVQRTERNLLELTNIRTQLEKVLQEKEIALTTAQDRITKLERDTSLLASTKQDLQKMTRDNDQLVATLAETQHTLERLEQSAKTPDNGLVSQATPASLSPGVNHSQESRAKMARLLPVMTANVLKASPTSEGEPARLLWARQAYLFSLHYDGIALASIDRSLRTALHSSPVRLRGIKGRINDLAFDSTGAQLIGASSTGKLLVWDTQEPLRPPRSFSGHSASVLNVQVSPRGQFIASGSQDSTIRLWKASRMTSAPQILQGHIKGVTTLAFSPDGQTLASGSQDHTIRVWDLTKNPPSNEIVGTHAGWVTTLVFTPDGRHLITAGDDLTIQSWDLQRPGSSPRVFRGHAHAISHLAVHPSGSVLASASRGTRIALWNLRETVVTPTFLKGHTKRVSHVAFSPDGHTLTSVGLDKSIRLWNWQKPEESPVVLPPQKGSLRTIAIAPDGSTLAVGGTGKTVGLWSSTTKLADAVCDSVQSNLSLQEWRKLVGPTLPYERTCPNLPLHPTFLKEGERLAKQGKQEQAKAIFQRAKKLDPFLEFDPQKEVERLSAKSS